MRPVGCATVVEIVHVREEGHSRFNRFEVSEEYSDSRGIRCSGVAKTLESVKREELVSSEIDISRARHTLSSSYLRCSVPWCSRP